jgi:hypothetical protein
MENIIYLDNGKKVQVGSEDLSTGFLGLSKKMNWEDAQVAVIHYGDDWRFPTIIELEEMYKQLFKKGVGNFNEHGYWSDSSGPDDKIYIFDFEEGKVQGISYKANGVYVRPVRDL